MRPENESQMDIQQNLKQETSMKPLTTDSARQPIQEETLDELTQVGEGNVENIDEIVQESKLVEGPDVPDRQVEIANRSAS